MWLRTLMAVDCFLHRWASWCRWLWFPVCNAFDRALNKAVKR